MPVVQRTRRLWTSKEDAELLEYYKHGLRPAYIAEQMERTIASIESRYAKLKKKENTNE